jgi:CBS domain containing-hemolysin-like protein
VPVGAIETEALRVPETMTLDALLGELRGRGYQMAVVLDEYGGTAGVATLEDCVEELVGDLVDEHDRTRAGIVRGSDSLTFPGILRPDELHDQAGVRVPESGLYETVAGYVVTELGRLPKVGDVVRTEQGTLEVLRLDGRRIDRLRFRADPDAPANRVETGPTWPGSAAARSDGAAEATGTAVAP